MNKAFKQSILFVAGLLVIGAVLSRYSDRIPASATQDWFIRGAEAPLAVKRAGQAGEIVALSAGSSHAACLDFPTLGKNGTAFTLPLGDLFETDHAVRALLPMFPNLETLYVSVSFYSFRWDTALASDEKYMFGRHLLYSLFPLQGWIRGDLRNWMKGVVRPLVRTDHWYHVVQALRSGQVVPNKSASPDPVQVEDGHHLARLREHAASRAQVVMEQSRVMLEQDPAIPSRARAALRSIMKTARDHNLELVFFTTPVHESFMIRIDPELVNQMRTEMASAVAEGARYLDFSTNVSLRVRHELFADSDHVSPEGSRIISAGF